MDKKTLLVVTAHVGDFVWRCGGAMALHTQQGYKVHVVCLSYGENGESNAAWVDKTAHRSEVKAIRHREAVAAGDQLGVSSIDFLDLGDYPLPDLAKTVTKLAAVMRELRPSVVITHPEQDPSNLDHALCFNTVLRARMNALAPGHGLDYISPFQVLTFEPHQSELCSFKPGLLLDISSVWDKKLKAMRAMPTQKNLWDYYERLALQRGAQAGRRGQSTGLYGEAYQSIFPSVVKTLL
jgi:4-oxalomesaconate hydratase